jgi:parallel beta-helix repeat protein
MNSPASRPGQSTGNTFAGNTANLNGRNGFEIHLFSNGNVFSENTANNNAATGFALNLSSNNQLSANTANGNAENGFALFQSNGNLLEDNTAIRNAFAGFALSQSGTNTLVGNRAKNNVAGFHLVSSSLNTIESNDGTPNSGIDAFQSAAPATFISITGSRRPTASDGSRHRAGGVQPAGARTAVRSRLSRFSFVAVISPVNITGGTGFFSR